MCVKSLKSLAMTRFLGKNSTNVLKKIVCENAKNPVIPRAYNHNLARTAPFLTLNRKTAVIFCTIYQYLARTMPLKPIYRKNFV